MRPGAARDLRAVHCLLVRQERREIDARRRRVAQFRALADQLRMLKEMRLIEARLS